jgi:hypothetical protein
MKVFEDLTKGIEAGQPACDFPIDAGGRMLSDSKGSPILLVFWKTL